MGKWKNRCAAANCEATDHLYSWPPESQCVRRAAWTRFVNVTVKSFQWKPTSRLCFRHFKAPDDFTNYTQYRLSGCSRLVIIMNSVNW